MGAIKTQSQLLGVAMNVAKRVVGHCVIHAAALGSPAAAGYRAAVVVACHGDSPEEHYEIFRDEWLDDGKVWQRPDEALAYALNIGEAAASTHEGFGTFSIESGPGVLTG